MHSTSLLEQPIKIDNLVDHIRERTFGRLHDLNVAHDPDGRLHVSAIAHSRFVGQLAEWAVLERIAPTDVDLAISVRRSTSDLIPSTSDLNEAQK